MGSFQEFLRFPNAPGPDGKAGGNRPQEKVKEAVNVLLTHGGKHQGVGRGAAPGFRALPNAVHFGKKLFQAFDDAGGRAGGTGRKKFQKFGFFVERVSAGLIGGNRLDVGKRNAVGKVSGAGVHEPRCESLAGVLGCIGGKNCRDAGGPGAEKRRSGIEKIRAVDGGPFDLSFVKRQFPAVDGSGEFPPGSPGTAVGDERKIVGPGAGENVSEINVVHVGH